MYYNLIQSKKNASEGINSFYGINRTEKPNKNEFKEMINMSSDRFPCLASAKSVRDMGFTYVSGVIKAVIAPQYAEGDIKGFTGVADNAFYYNGERKSGETIPKGDVTLADFNGRIVICVYDGSESHMRYYDYTATGAKDDRVKKMETEASANCTVYSSGNPEEDITVTNYIEADNMSWNTYFKEGDSVFIEGSKYEENNTVQLDSRYQNVSKTRAISCIVEKIEDTKDSDGNVTSSKLYLQLYNRDGAMLVMKKVTTAETLTVKIKMPTMNHICIHNNRLWGTNPNGEYVYASKLGDCFNFNTFQGLANDSFYAEVGTPGGFVGIVSYRDNLVAFKRDYIHHIYGDKPSNFTMPKQLSDCGCIDIRSAVQIGYVLYFLGYGGIYAYAGGQPELISQKLDSKYTSAVAMTDGQKYIVSCKGDESEFLVYDTRYGTWHKEDYIAADAIGSFRWHDKVYIATSDAVYEYGAQAPQEWECESVIIHEDIFDNKGMTELWIRAKIEKGGYIDVETSEDGGQYLHRGRLEPNGLKVYRLPVRFINGEYYQYKLKGYGNAVIYDIERKVSAGGRTYKG